MREGLCVGLVVAGQDRKRFLTTAGACNTRIVTKTDTEPAMIDLRNEVARKRNDVPTGFDDS